eukprot:368431_1
MSNQGHSLFRNKTINTVLVVPTKARRYRNALYLFNFILTGFGLTCLSLSVVMLANSRETFFPDWAFQILLSIGFMILLIGFLGGRGAVVSFRCLHTGEYNWWLIVLTFLVTVLIAAEIGSGIWAMTAWEVIKSDTAKSQADAFTETFETKLKQQLNAQPELWWDFQKGFECCGYHNNTIPSSLATGKYCTTDYLTSAPGCKQKMWSNIGDNALPFTMFGIIFVIIQLAVCISG